MLKLSTYSKLISLLKLLSCLNFSTGILHAGILQTGVLHAGILQVLCSD